MLELIILVVVILGVIWCINILDSSRTPYKILDEDGNILFTSRRGGEILNPNAYFSINGKQYKTTNIETFLNKKPILVIYTVKSVGND